MPYLLPWLNGTAGVGIKREFDEISFNFFVAGGGANGGALDHDDGSSFYHDHGASREGVRERAARARTSAQNLRA